MSFPAAFGPLRVPKYAPATSLSVHGGTWRGPSASRRPLKSELWRPKSAQGHPIGRQETPTSAPERSKRRQKPLQIAFWMEKVDLLKSTVFLRKNHTFSCPRAPKSVRNRAQTLSRTIFDDILRRKSLEETLGSGSDSPKDAQRTPKNRPRRPKSRKRDFAPPPLFLIRRVSDLLCPWDFLYIFIQKCAFRLGGVAKSTIRRTLRCACLTGELRSQPVCYAYRHYHR